MNALYAMWLRILIGAQDRWIVMEQDRRELLTKTIESDKKRLEELRLELYALECDQP